MAQLAARYRALCQSGMDPSEAEATAFAELLGTPGFAVERTPDLYEAFVTSCAPKLRRERGVYCTPLPVARAQVRLVQDLLRSRLGCPDGYADERVLVVDPATGSGVYALTILELVAPAEVDGVKARMRLFEAQPGAAALARARGLTVVECDVLEYEPTIDAPVVVCVGNPPYRRRRASPSVRRDLADFVSPTGGIHRKNLYNDYVAFWRWALRVGLEARRGPAIVCFVTAASYLRGPAFEGMRGALRRGFDELWLVDLEGDQRAARASHNVFPIRTPVAIGMGIRYGQRSRRAPAAVHYTRLAGTADDKLATLDALVGLGDLPWQTSNDPSGGLRQSRFATWPGLTELFPWQLSGAQLKRTWPIGVTPDVLRERWQCLLALSGDERRAAFGATRDRNVDTSPPDLLDRGKHLPALIDLAEDVACPEPARYAYRAFDRQWVLPDARLGDFLRPALWRAHGPRQVYLTSMLTNVLGPGPAVIATALVPDLDHFRGSFGARAVIPLWRDSAASQANVSDEWLARLSERYGFTVSAADLLAYCYALQAGREYVRRFADELRTPGPRVPLTRDGALFQRGATLGAELIAMHAYSDVVLGAAELQRPFGDGYPDRFAYEARTQTVRIGEACIGPVSTEVWDFSVSGYRIVGNWLSRRIRPRIRSRLEAIQPRTWTAGLTRELLELVWLLERTLEREPVQADLLREVISGGGLQRRLVEPRQQVDHRLGLQRTREQEALTRVAPELFEPIPL